MNPSTSLGTRSNVGMAKPSPPVRQAGNIGRLLVIHGVCRRSVPSACPQVKYRCRCREKKPAKQNKIAPSRTVLRLSRIETPSPSLQQASSCELPCDAARACESDRFLSLAAKLKWIGCLTLQHGF